MNALSSGSVSLLTGRQPVLEALKSGRPIEKIYVAFGSHGSVIEKLKNLARRGGIPVVELSKQRFAELAGDQHAQGVAALLSPRAYTDVDALLEAARARNEQPFLLLLDEIEDPHNLGALLRTAECAGVHGVILPKHHTSPLTPTVVKASAGASLHLPIAKVTNLASTIETLKHEGIWVVGTDDGAPTSYRDVDYRGAVAIVIGNEGKGMRRLVRERCDTLVRIPVFGKIQSLNASVAGGLVLFEVLRSRGSA